MAKRYTVDYEHFENAMLTEARIGYEVFFAQRFKLPRERREKITALLKRFVAEIEPELQAFKEQVVARQGQIEKRLEEVVHPGASTNFANGN